MKANTSPSSLLMNFCLLACLAMLISGCPRSKEMLDRLVSKEMPGRFGIYVCNLNGDNLKVIATDSYREINHARVSPDHQWITFTRYNKRGLNGLAEEIGGYQNTEIMLMKLDGTKIMNLTTIREYPMAANGSWTPDGKSIVFVGGSSTDKFSRLYQVDVGTKAVMELPVLPGEYLADPHIVGKQLIFTVRELKPITRNVIYILKLDGSSPRKITSPKIHLSRPPEPPEGDFDPKLSPDGSETAFMRHDGKSWHIVVYNLNSGKERDLSLEMDGGDADAVPEWSSDGKLLLFWHVNLKNMRKSGLYTMKPDGSERKQIPLPPGYFYTMPAFFPGDGSSPDVRIIFSAKKL
jgi:Tol biopolymer transport system component